MSAQHWTNPLTLRRGFISVLALGAASLLIVASASAQNILRNVRGEMERLKSTIEGDVSSLKEDVREEVAYLLGDVHGIAPDVVKEFAQCPRRSARTLCRYSCPKYISQ